MDSPAFQLVRLRSGAWGMRSREYGEICHPGVGPEAEADALYVDVLPLPRRGLAEKGHFVIWDVGLGGAANALAVIRRARDVECKLRLVSFDRTLEPLAFALDHAEALGYLGGLQGIARRLLKEPDVTFTHGHASIDWTRVLGDFAVEMTAGTGFFSPAPHAILY